MAITSNYGWEIPDVGLDADTWGTIQTALFNAIDASMAFGRCPTATVCDFLLASAPPGWLELNGQTIGDASSGATFANSTALTLFLLMWGTFSNTIMPLLNSDGTSSSRGANAQADWNAHKRLTLIDQRDLFRRSYKSGGSSAALGTAQVDAFQGFVMPFKVATGSGFAGSGDVSWMQGSTSGAGGNYSGTTLAPVSDGSHGAPRITSETRPANISYLTCIKL